MASIRPPMDAGKIGIQPRSPLGLTPPRPTPLDLGDVSVVNRTEGTGYYRKPIPPPGPPEDLARWPQVDSWSLLVLLCFATLVGGMGGAIVVLVGMMLA